jgi:putative acetyltransferase
MDNALRLELTVYTDNVRAIRLYERYGFQVEGTLRGFGLRHGQYVDALTMARWYPAPARPPVLSEVTRQGAALASVAGA